MSITDATEQAGVAGELILIFQRYSVPISPGIPATPTECLCAIPQSLQTISGIMPWINQERFLRDSFEFFIH
jgi:hypothetical protein